jgi:mono/diheme cytochrome c family protein
MMKNTRLGLATLLVSLSLAAWACDEGDMAAPDATESVAEPSAAEPAAERDDRVARGRYLVTIGGCHDCHTPWKLGENGPEPDMTRALSGHPADLIVPDAPASEGVFSIAVAGTMTAWRGGWGTSFTANLTPDEETGLGAWTTETFVSTIRNGRHMGRGRPLLPPMPYPNYAQMTDEDLASVFAYLQTLEPIENRVPAPRPPLAPEPADQEVAGLSRSSSATSQ